MVEGTWALGGIQRGTNWCFLTPCPGNLRDEATLLRLIQQFVLPGQIKLKSNLVVALFIQSKKFKGVTQRSSASRQLCNTIQ